MANRVSQLFITVSIMILTLLAGQVALAQADTLVIPFLNESPTIDGDLSEWKHYAFHDGVWDIYRVQASDWYQPKRNRLTDHGDEPDPAADLQARYYIAWDKQYLYLGADVLDNVIDVSESRHAPKRWYYKDAIAWFIEAPQDTVKESFQEGDHGFAFVIDNSYPSYGAWWRRGTAEKSFIETPLPEDAHDYRLTLKEEGYILEARVHLQRTLGQTSPAWEPPQVGHRYGLMIVHCDPDGGEYGGHLLIYGRGDADDSWHTAILDSAILPVKRRHK